MFYNYLMKIDTFIEHIRRMNKGKLLPIIRIVAVRHGKHKLRNRFQHIAGPIGSRADLELHAPHAVDETQYRDKLHLPQAHSLAVTLIPAASVPAREPYPLFVRRAFAPLFPLRGIKPTHNRIATTNFWLERLAYRRAPYSQSASETVVRPRHGSLQNAADHRRI